MGLDWRVVEQCVTSGCNSDHTARRNRIGGNLLSPDSGELMVTFETVMEIKILHKQE